ncbi:MAG: N-acetyl-gamma-glutamyl-phosphate reductase, partial [Acidiferrobacterales bacterium]
LTVITSRGEKGRAVSDLFPSLRGFVDLIFSEPDAKTLGACDVVFSATPNGIAMQHARALMDAGTKLIDLAADFRLKDIDTWQKWYGMEHTCPELVGEAVYGLPEVNREAIKTANIIANPGCYPTACQLGLLPLVENELVNLDNLIADCKSGISGSGRGAKVDALYSEVADSMQAYAVPGHRHLPEIRQGLELAAGRDVGLTFVPHLVPMNRGIHATLYAKLKKPVELQDLYETRYQSEPFVDVMPPGSHPETRSVRATNTCRIAVFQPQKDSGGDTIVVLSVIDNLVKGAAGQAVQNMNIMFGFDETMGIGQPGLMP